MAPLQILAISWLAIGAFVFSAVWNTNPIWRAIVLLVCLLCVHLIPCTFEEVGWVLAYRYRLYGLGLVLLRCSDVLFRWLPALFKNLRSTGAVAISQLFILRGERNQACNWAERALAIDCGGDETAKFKALSVAGDAYFSAGRLDKARECLAEASQMYPKLGTTLSPEAQQTWIGQWLGERIDENFGQTQANNFDIMCSLCLESSDPSEARTYAERSVHLRRRTKPIADAAAAYLDDALGTIARRSGETEQAGKYFLSAYEKLPSDLNHEDTRRLAFRIYGDLRALQTPAGEQARKMLGDRLGIRS